MVRAYDERVTTTSSGTRIVWPRSVAAFVVGGVLTALLLGVPTDVIPNGWFGRMTPVEDYAVPALVATSVLSGLLVASWLGIEVATCPVRASDALFGAWWLDPAVGLLIAAVALEEGREAWRGEGCCVSAPLAAPPATGDVCQDDCCAD